MTFNATFVYRWQSEGRNGWNFQALRNSISVDTESHTYIQGATLDLYTMPFPSLQAA